jgi:transcriptional regulator with XRE-family HTH domain
MNRVQAFGKAVRTRRLELKLKQKDLAERADLHVNFISLVERGVSSAGIDSVFAIADALDSTAAELIAIAEATATRKGKS